MIGVTVAALTAGPVVAQDNYGGSQGRSPTIGQRFDSFRRNLLGSPEPAPTQMQTQTNTNIREPAPQLSQSKAAQSLRSPKTTTTAKQPSQKQSFDPFTSEFDQTPNVPTKKLPAPAPTSRRHGPFGDADLVEQDLPPERPLTSSTASNPPRSSSPPTKSSQKSNDDNGWKNLMKEPTSTPRVARAEKYSSSKSSLPGDLVASDDAAPIEKPAKHTAPTSRTTPSSRTTRSEVSSSDVPVRETSPREMPPAESSSREIPSREISSRAPAMVEAPVATASKPIGKLPIRSSPNLSVETVGPHRIVVGRESQYTIHLRNSGDMPASDVTVHVAAPSWAEVVEARASSGTAATGDDGTFHWKVSSVGAQSHNELVLKIIPRKSQGFDLGVRWTYAAPATQTTVEVDEPKLQMSIAGPSEMVFGQQQVYKLTISNPGTGDADDVVIHLLPITTGENTTASHRIGKLKAGASLSVEIELTARQAGRLSIRAEATGEGDLKAAANTEVQVRRAALEVAANTPKTHYAGPPITCEVHVKNSGDSIARQVAVTTLLPSGAEFVSASDGGHVEGKSGDVVWSIPQLAPGAETVVSCKYTVKASGNSRIEAMVTADGDLRATGSASTHVLAIADLVLDLVDSPGPVPIGEDTVYVIKVRNRGSSAAEDVGVVAYFSEGIEPTGVDGGTYELGPGTVTFKPCKVAAGGETVYRVSAKAATGGRHQMRVEMSSESLGTKLSQDRTTLFYGQE
jgi:uncharacterized repeat protein (TIGR01451 family)